MTAEAAQWERLRFAAPYAAMEVQAQRDKHRALRENALALVRARKHTVDVAGRAQLLLGNTLLACLRTPHVGPGTCNTRACTRSCRPQVHDYNRVVSSLDARERVLFHDRLRALDKRVTPGAGKLTWSSDRATLELYFREVRRGWGGVEL